MTSPIQILKISTYRYGIVFHVIGSSGEKYIVDYNIHKGWLCDCPDHLFRHGFCKHMKMCMDYMNVKLGVELSSNVWFENPSSNRIFQEVTA